MVVAPAVDSQTTFVFDHELFRDALYTRLAPAERRRLHGSVAQALSPSGCDATAASACVIAHHLGAALPDGDPRICVRYCILAAQQAGRSYAYADSARHLGHAIDALSLLPEGSPRLRLKLLFGR